MDWIGAGLPWEGSDASQPTLGSLATPDVPVCSIDETIGATRARLGDAPTCVVLNDERIVLGLVAADALDAGDDQPVSAVMEEGPSTYRPHVPAAEMAERLAKHPEDRILVTTADGRLVGIAGADDITEAARADA